MPLIGRRRRSVKTNVGGVRSQRATMSTGVVAVSPALNREGPMSRKVIKGVLSGVYYEGIKIVTSGDNLGSLISTEKAVDIAMTAAIEYASNEFVVPMVAPMIPIQSPQARKILPSVINAGVSVGLKVGLGRLSTQNAPMDFFYTVGANVAADMSVDTVSGIFV